MRFLVDSTEDVAEAGERMIKWQAKDKLTGRKIQVSGALATNNKEVGEQQVPAKSESSIRTTFRTSDAEPARSGEHAGVGHPERRKQKLS